MIVKTSNMSHKGPNRLDITVKSGDKVFAPTRDMVKYLKADRLSWESYEAMYHYRMRKSYREHRARWDEVLAMDEVVLVCYCETDDHCHRRLLAEYLVKCGAEVELEVGDVRENRCNKQW